MKMKILRDCTKDVAERAWMASRHLGADTSGIKDVDAPVMDFPVVTLAVECTILEREIIVSYRDHVMWARTSRVDSPLDFVVDPCVAEELKFFVAAAKSRMIQDMNEGMAQDQYRMSLPVMALTSFTMQISTRSLIKLYRTFRDLRAAGCSDTDDLFSSAIIAIGNVLSDIGISAADSKIKYVNVLPTIKNGATGRVGDMLTVYLPRAPLALRAQVIRHRSLSVKDGLRDFIIDGLHYTIGNTLPMSVSADVDTWIDIISKRSCWMAQHDLWKPLVDIARNQLGSDERLLPCSKGVCPYDLDAKLRYTDKDPGAPCPMHAWLNKRNLDWHEIQACEDQVEAEGRPEFWSNIIAQHKDERK